MSYRNGRPAARPRENESSSSVQQPSSPPVARPQPQPLAKIQPNKKKRPSLAVKIIIVILLLAVASLAAWYFIGKGQGASASIDNSKYQAVFFSDGRVYFGKLGMVDSQYMRLKNVYYLQKKADAQSNTSSPQSAEKQDASDYELIKLGNEIHGPEDEMIIATSQVQFFENLKPAGTVSQTISNFQKNQ